MVAIPNRDFFAGCLVGQCLGDAFGFPVEGFPPKECQRYVSAYLTDSPVHPSGRGIYRFGQYTDDSQLAREMLQSYVECQRFDPEDYAKRISSIFLENRIVGRGLTTAQAARRLASGIPWTGSGIPAPSAGNGSAMRAAPVGLMFCDNADDLISAAHDQGRITHADPRCSAGAVAIGGAVALALKKSETLANWPGQLSDWAGAMNTEFSDYLLRLPDWLQLAPGEAVGQVALCGADPEFQGGWEGISPFVIGSVLWSLYSFLRSPDNYMETIRTAIAVGGDVDTTAAMAGAISGAYLGFAALPQSSVMTLTDRGSWGYSELVDLAHRCHALRYGDSVS